MVWEVYMLIILILILLLQLVLRLPFQELLLLFNKNLLLLNSKLPRPQSLHNNNSPHHHLHHLLYQQGNQQKIEIETVIAANKVVVGISLQPRNQHFLELIRPPLLQL